MQVVGQPPDQCPPIRFGRWLKAFFAKFCENERINGRSYPCVIQRRNGRPVQCGQRPPLRRLGPRCALLDPLADAFHFGGRQRLPLERHGGLSSGNQLVEETLGGLAGHDRRTTLAAFADIFNGRERKATCSSLISYDTSRSVWPITFAHRLH